MPSIEQGSRHERRQALSDSPRATYGKHIRRLHILRATLSTLRLRDCESSATSRDGTPHHQHATFDQRDDCRGGRQHLDASSVLVATSDRQGCRTRTHVGETDRAERPGALVRRRGSRSTRGRRRDGVRDGLQRRHSKLGHISPVEFERHAGPRGDASPSALSDQITARRDTTWNNRHGVTRWLGDVVAEPPAPPDRRPPARPAKLGLRLCTSGASLRPPRR